MFLFRRLPGLSHTFLLKVWLLVWFIRLGLWLLPFRQMRRIVTRLATGPARPRWPAPEQIAWAVTATSNYAISATCLTQALTTQILLKRYGHPAELKIGVAHDENGKFEAHAWIESDGEIVIGGAEAELAEKFVAMPTLEGLK